MNDQLTFDLEEGKRLRDEALDRVQGETVIREIWVRLARSFAVAHALTTGSVTSDDVREAIPIPDGADPRILGAVFRSSKSSDYVFVRTGYTQTKVAQAHARPISVWRVARVKRPPRTAQ